MDRRLIIEIYEYTEGASVAPPFEYIPCDLTACFKRNNRASLQEIIQKGFDTLPRRNQDVDKRQAIFKKLEEADIGKISVVYNPGSASVDPCIELTNVMPVTMAYADARRVKEDKNDIILYGRYRLTEGNETTVLRDAQRLTLIYTSRADGEEETDEAEDGAEPQALKEICLNITFLQGER